MPEAASITYWLFKAEVWLIFALVLVVADILFGLGLFVLPVGVAAAIVSALLYAENNFWFSDTIILESWREVLFVFALLSLACVFLIRKIFQKGNDRAPDINDY